METMLCRVADSLFWMSRYLERAENTARLVDVNLQLLLDSDSADVGDAIAYWTPILSSLGDAGLFEDLYEEMNNQNVEEFLILNRENPSSAFSCVVAARENARMVRDQISEEMWEVINRLYHYLKRYSGSRFAGQNMQDVFTHIKETSSLFVGVTESTYPHQIGYEFIKAGRYLERAEKVGRIIESSQRWVDSANRDAVALTHWVAALRACSGSAAYQRAYHGDIESEHVLNLLLSSREFPRSMLFSLSRLQLAIHAISACPLTHYSNEAERLCGRLISDLNYTSTTELIERGVQSFLERARNEIESIALKLSEKYMFFPVVDTTAKAAKE